jgi:type I restriction enzyme S subunit
VTGKRAFDGETAELESLCAAITDCHHSTPNWADAGWIVVRSENIKNGKISLDSPSYTNEASFRERIARSVPQPGDLIITREAPMGEIGMIPDGVTCCLGQRQVLIKPDAAKVDKHYLLYAMQSHFVQMQIGASNATGSTVSNLRIPLLKELAIPLIGDKLTQGRIAAVLSALDAKIDLNHRINTELEALAKTIYDYWFVQFDFPDAHGRPYKSSGGAMAWNDTLKREIPAGWEVVAIGRACETILGGTPNTKNPDYWDCADIPWLSSSETASFPVVTSEQKITAAGIRDSAAKLLPAGTVVVSIVRYIRPSILGIAAATNQSVAGILETAQFPSSYLYPAVCREIPRWMDLRTGAQQPHINKATIDGTLLVKPSKGVIDAYRKIADPLFKRVLVSANENRELTQLRDWLLPLLMNGQVRVA